MQLATTIPPSISTETIHRGLKKAGLKAVVKCKHPFLSKHHQRERLDFATSHQHWTVEDWKRVIWSDETKINHLGSDGKWAWKKAGEGLSSRLVQGTVKFGGVWDGMEWDLPARLMVKWMLTSMFRYWRMSSRKAFSMGKNL